jgi:hypothetical protein
MKAGDIINWPQDVKFQRIGLMNIEEVQRLHELAKKDLLDFTSEFLINFKNSGNDLRSEVLLYLSEKLAKKLNRKRIYLPLKSIKEGDIINWPPDVKFKRIRQMNSTELKKLHELVKKDLLDFTPEFLSQFKIIKKSADELRADLTKYLAEKLAKKLNVSIIQIPWLYMKAGDIINWPPDVKFAPIRNMETMEVKKLNELAKKDLLDFTPEFLSQIKIIKDSGNELRADFTKYLADKLARKLNVSSIRIPWSKMKAGDIINWPQDVKLIPIYNMNMKDIQRLHELVKKDILDFSPGLITRLREEELLKGKSAMPQFQEIIRDIETALCNKLNAGTNKNFNRVPWAILKTEDVYNWPEGVRFIRLSQLGKKHLRLLHKLRDVIFFSKEFLQRLSDPSFDKTISQYIISDNA